MGAATSNMKKFPTRSKLSEIIRQALEKLFKNDAHLIEVDANERSITHRLAIYIEENLKEMHLTWDVDCEIHRNGHEAKSTGLFTESVDNGDLHACTVYPDIIVHHRDTDDNLLVIEVKKSSNNKQSDRDRKKIESVRRPPLSYRHGLCLTLRTDNKKMSRWSGVWSWSGGQEPFQEGSQANCSSD